MVKKSKVGVVTAKAGRKRADSYGRAALRRVKSWAKKTGALK